VYISLSTQSGDFWIHPRSGDAVVMRWSHHCICLPTLRTAQAPTITRLSLVARYKVFAFFYGTVGHSLPKCGRSALKEAND